ncbi:MAG: DUF4139 domain-containing protein [Spirochaetaceae bacterium]|jgi:hypothetical protein|nr:DUF4139 domain-containing protein [Spirochaetaceae bacterium]
MRTLVLFAAVVVLLSQPVSAQGKVSIERESPSERESPIERQSPIEGTLPLKKVSLLTSGVGYFEHSGTVNGGTDVDLSFHLSAMNDALKSLVVRDPKGSSLQVRYPSENYIWSALEDLSIDLRGNPDIIEVLRRQQGAEVTLIVLSEEIPAGVDRGARDDRPAFSEETISGVLLSANDRTVSVSTANGIRVIETSALRSVAFTDPRLNEDLRKALAVLRENRASSSRRVTVSLNGNGTREASLSYVIPAAVWKASYRLDLSAQKPFLQAWAIVDNDSGVDWENTALTLVSGRPVSFVQQLYPPYRLGRPVKPLEIAGAAEAQVYGSVMMENATAAEYAADAGGGVNGVMSAQKMRAPAPAASVMERAEMGFAVADSAAVGRTGAGASSAVTDTGFLFEWTFKNPVTIARGQSVMLPLTEGEVEARKVLIFNGRNASTQGTHPQIGVELTNTTGQKLPPGPVTVFDNGSYAGDALVSFLGAGEKRLLSFADDLSVSGSVSANSRRVISAVKISGGVMTITRKTSYEITYTFNNTAMEEKSIVIEHPIRFNAALAVPEKADERTESVYRFNRTLPARQSLSFQVVEEIPASERLSLSGMSIDSPELVSFITNGEIPENVRAALQQAVALRQAANAEASRVDEINAGLTRAEAEQARIRDNLTAVGTDTEAGGQYLARLQEIDTRIDAINAEYDKALAASRAANKAYHDYIAGLELF